MSEKKKVIVFTTGGTIAMKFDPKVTAWFLLSAAQTWPPLFLVWINLLMLKSESFQIMPAAR